MNQIPQYKIELFTAHDKIGKGNPQAVNKNQIKNCAHNGAGYTGWYGDDI